MEIRPCQTLEREAFGLWKFEEMGLYLHTFTSLIIWSDSARLHDPFCLYSAIYFLTFDSV